MGRDRVSFGIMTAVVLLSGLWDFTGGARAAQAGNGAGALPPGSVVRVDRDFRFPRPEPRLQFQDGAPKAERDVDQERPFCTLMVKTAGGAEPIFRAGEEIVVTASMTRVYGSGLAADVSRLQLDPRINLLICWGRGSEFPTLPLIRQSLGSWLTLVPAQ